MPEGIEAELSRVALCAAVGRTITSVVVDDRVSPPGFAAAVVGATIVGVRRAGKVCLLDVVDGAGGDRATGPATIGIHFGMTGRVLVNGEAPIGDLAYGSVRDDPAWRRAAFTLDGAATSALMFVDPRRLGHLSIDPLLRLGPDAFALTARELAVAVDGRRAPIKSVLMDQHRVAGLGNLCVDEVLYWASIDPHRPSASLTTSEVRVLAGRIRSRLRVMLRRGGSHTGVIDPAARATLPPCDRDGVALVRGRVGGRTTVWCPGHQR